jgi:hypothetical protein
MLHSYVQIWSLTLEVLGFLHLHLKKKKPGDTTWYEFVIGTNHINYEYPDALSLIFDTYATYFIASNIMFPVWQVLT